MRFGGGCYVFGLCEREFLTIQHTFYAIILLGRRLLATYCTVYHGLQWMKEEQGS
jgi:hypothetical protein